MSWPIRKSSASSLTGNSTGINRQSSSSSHTSAGIGVVPRSVQLDFDKEEKKIQQLEQTNKKFYKDVKCYVDKIEELNKSETKMINNLSGLANPTSTATELTGTNFQSEEIEFLAKLKLWKDLLNEHNSTCEGLKGSCQTQVIEPMKKLNSLFPQVYEAIKRRQHAFNELCKQQSKLDKALEKERTGVQIVKIEQLKQLVATSKQQFQREHSVLMEELPKLYNSRVDYIRPCVSALLESQAKFYDSYSKFYDSILNLNENTASQIITNENTDMTTNEESIESVSVEKIDTDIQKCLGEIKSLSIVAGD